MRCEIFKNQAKIYKLLNYSKKIKISNGFNFFINFAKFLEKKLKFYKF